MKRSLLALVALLSLCSAAVAQTKPLPPPEIRGNGDIMFGNALKLGKRQSGKTTFTPDTLQILGSGSTGDISNMSVVPDAAAPETTLSGILANKAGLLNPAFRGVPSITDIGRTSQNDNTPTLGIEISEGLGFPSYVTHYGVIVNARQTATGKGDRIAHSSIQTCEAMPSGQSCVGSNSISNAAGEGKGNYTGGNSIVKLPPGLIGPALVAAGHEVNTHTHSPVTIKNGLRIADESLINAPTTHGTLEDAAIAVVVSDHFNVGTLGFGVGIQFGENRQGYPKSWPILAGGTLIQADNPNVRVSYGIDFKGSTSGFNNGAIVLPINSQNNGIYWGDNHQGGSIQSTATAGGPIQTFTDNGLFINKGNGDSLLQVFNTGMIVVPGAMQVSGAISSGNFVRNGTLIAADATKVSPTSGQTVTMSGAYSKLILDPSGTLSSLTVQFPASPVNGQVVEISTTQTITALTLSGQGKPIANSATNLSSGPLGKLSYTYVGSAGAWYP